MTIAELVQDVTDHPAHLLDRFPVAARQARREGLDPDDARVRLVTAVTGPAPEVAALVTRVYDYGDPSERLSVLHALADLDDGSRPEPIGDRCLGVVRDALRSNDSRIVAAAMGPYAAAHLDAAAWRQAMLKLVFMGVPVSVAAGVTERVDAELQRMLRDYAAERGAASRTVPADVALLLSLAVVDEVPPGAAQAVHPPHPHTD